MVPKFLKLLGWNCITAFYQEDFLGIAAELQPDIIFLDHFSNNEVGFCRQLKNNEKTKNIRLFVITYSDENISIAIEAGADGHLNAPVFMPDLQKIIQPESLS
jgi:CheY-like chemotaxis protein